MYFCLLAPFACCCCYFYFIPAVVAFSISFQMAAIFCCCRSFAFFSSVFFSFFRPFICCVSHHLRKCAPGRSEAQRRAGPTWQVISLDNLRDFQLICWYYFLILLAKEYWVARIIRLDGSLIIDASQPELDLSPRRSNKRRTYLTRTIKIICLLQLKLLLRAEN